MPPCEGSKPDCGESPHQYEDSCAVRARCCPSPMEVLLCIWIFPLLSSLFLRPCSVSDLSHISLPVSIPCCAAATALGPSWHFRATLSLPSWSPWDPTGAEHGAVSAQGYSPEVSESKRPLPQGGVLLTWAGHVAYCHGLAGSVLWILRMGFSKLPKG